MGAIDEAVVDPNLLGVWRGDKEGETSNQSRLVITRPDNTTRYLCFTLTSSLNTQEFEGYVSVVDGEHYINFPVKPWPGPSRNELLGAAFLVENPSDFYDKNGHYVFIHYSIDATSRMAVSFPSEQFFKDAVRAGRIKGKLYGATPWTPYDAKGNPRKADKDVYVKLTCSTNDLVRFVSAQPKNGILEFRTAFRKIKKAP